MKKRIFEKDKIVKKHYNKIMLWFKKISHKNVRITPEINKIIDNFVRFVVKYYMSNNKTTEVDAVEFINPYTNQKETRNIGISPKNNKYKNALGAYVPDTKTILVFPYHIDYFYTNINETFLLQKFTENITHEFVHAIDPKFSGNFRAIDRQEKLQQTDAQGKKYISDYDYFNFPTEFDAYCKQITIFLQKLITDNPNNRIEILNWMRGPLNYIPSFFGEYKKSLDQWIEHDKKSKVQHVKNLRDRIYDELFDIKEAPLKKDRTRESF